MKKIRNGMVLALSLMVCLSGFTACSKKPDAFEHETFTKVADELDIDDFDIEDLIKDIGYAAKDSEGYLTVTNEDYFEDIESAQYLYDVLINRLRTYSVFQVDEFSVLSVGTEGQNYLFLMTFDNKDKAKKFYDEYTEDFEEDGKEKKYEYAYTSTTRETGRINTKAAYVKGDRVIVVMSIDDSTDALEEVFEELNLVSPV